MPSSPAGFGWLDWSVVIAYFLGVTAFGMWIARSIRTSGGYFLGDRRLPWWIMIGQSFGTGTHAENPVAQAGSSYAGGFATIWYQWKNMLITPFYWLMAPWYRRSGRTTLGEIVSDRYGRGMALVYTLFALAFFVFTQGAMLKGAAKVIAVATGGAISPDGIVLTMTIAFIVYSFFGGLVASAYTDFIQGFLIIVLSFMLIPAGLMQLGGFTGMRASLPANFFELFNEASGLDAFTIAMLSINGLLGMAAQPHVLSLFATGSSERAGRIGHTYGSLVKRFCTIGWALTGLIVAAMLVRAGGQLDDKEHAFGYACRHLLGPGWTGLMVSCVLAANMSTCSNFMVNTGALFTRNLYQDFLRPAASDREVLWIGRFSGLGLTLAGVLFALYVGEVLQAFLFTETIAAFMGIMLVGGIFWRRANRWGAAAATLASFGVYYALAYRAAGQLQLVYKWRADEFAYALVAGIATLVVVSLLTPAESAERLAAFFGRMRSDDDGNDLLLVDMPGWFRRERWQRFFTRYREDLVGFVAAWAVVGLLIAAAWALMQLGR